MTAQCTACNTTLTCPTSDSCTLICSVDCTLCIARCGSHLDELVEETPWLLKAEKLVFTTTLPPKELAALLGRLLNRELIPVADSEERLDVTAFTGTVDEILERTGLRAGGYAT